MHSNVDQFFRIEQREAKFVFNEKKERPGARRRCGRRSGRNVPQCGEYVEDGDVEAIYHLLSAEPPGRDSAQDRGGGCRIGGAPLNQCDTGCHETKYIRDMGLAFYYVDYWACGCLDLGRHPRLGAEMNWYSLRKSSLHDYLTFPRKRTVVSVKVTRAAGRTRT